MGGPGLPIGFVVSCATSEWRVWTKTKSCPAYVEPVQTITQAIAQPNFSKYFRCL